MQVCAQAGGVSDAVRLFGEHDPDITLMDLRLPDGRNVRGFRTYHQRETLPVCRKQFYFALSLAFTFALAAFAPRMAAAQATEAQSENAD